MKKNILAVIVFLPLLLGWEKVNLQEFLKAQELLQLKSAQEPVQLQGPQAIPPDVSAYRILEKTTAAVYRTKSMHVEMEAWFENPAFHIKSYFNNDIVDLDNYRTNGKISLSLFDPYNFSTSNWVQTYQIRGIPFTWDLNKREWRQEELNISARDKKKVLGYGVLSSMFTVNEGAVNPSTVNLLGVEKRKGRNCFVLQYKLDPKFFKRWDLAGDITVKIWIDCQDFLPQMMRSEGKLADVYILQIANYTDYNSNIDLAVPKVVTEEVDKEKTALTDKIDSLKDSVAKIMGWQMPEKVNVEFKGRGAFGDYLNEEFRKEYTKDRVAHEEFVLKWLGLLQKDADYKESILNSEISSIGGVYDPEKKTIFMGDWIPPSFAELILVHEIAHAFQDRNFDLEKFSGWKEQQDNFDYIYARKSVSEGEATAIMLEYLLNSDGKSFKDLEDVFPMIEEKLLKNSPYVRQDVVYSIYGYGANFIQSLLKQGEWGDLDKVFKSPPVSMKEIIHPYKYYMVKPGIAAKASGAGQNPAKDEAFEIKPPKDWKAGYQATLGEFMLLMSLRQSVDRDVAEKACAGLQKDRIFVFENNGGKRVICLVTKWDRESDAGEYAAAYSEWLKKRYPQSEEKNAGKYKLFDLQDKEMVSCLIDKNLVKIVWSQELGKKEFKTLVANIYSIAK
ncbi:MAG: hypothetical protein PHN57_00300 [Candidatus Omnitrophica bacterium]|nr:hypothetical protein [Candidatus Omnitrophota bacterium]